MSGGALAMFRKRLMICSYEADQHEGNIMSFAEAASHFIRQFAMDVEITKTSEEVRNVEYDSSTL